MRRGVNRGFVLEHHCVELQPSPETQIFDLRQITAAAPQRTPLFVLSEVRRYQTWALTRSTRILAARSARLRRAPKILAFPAKPSGGLPAEAGNGMREQ